MADTTDSAVARAALGTSICYSTDAGTSYTVLGEVLSIDGGGGGELGKRETTNLASTCRTYMPTIPDPGELKVSLNFDPSDSVHTQITDWVASPASTNPTWQIRFATDPVTTATFTGFVSSVDGPSSEDVDDNLTLDFTVQLTSVPTFATSS